MFGNFSYDKCFWKVLTYLDNLEEKISVEELSIIGKEKLMGSYSRNFSFKGKLPIRNIEL